MRSIYRRTPEDLRTDLRGADLSGRDLERLNLSERDLTGAVLCNASLVLADLHNAILVDADLSGADLRGANLTNADLRGATLEGARVRDALTEGVIRVDSSLVRWGPEAELARQMWTGAVSHLLLLLKKLSSKNDEEVLEAVELATIQLPGWSFPAAHVARRLVEDRRTTAAVALLRSADAYAPSLDTRKILGRLLLEAEDFKGARAALDNALLIDPDDGQVLAELGYSLGRLGELDEARTSLERAVDLGVRDANTWSALGMVANGQNDLAVAGSSFVEAARVSDWAKFHVENLSRFYEVSGDLVEALSVLHDDEQPRFRDDQTLLRIADIASRLGDLDQAVGVFDKVLKSAPESAEARLGRADALLRRGDLFEASAAIAGLSGPGAQALADRIEARIKRQAAPVGALAESTPRREPLQLPLTQEELAAGREILPDLSPFVDHLFFASPHAIGHLVNHGEGTALLFRGPGATSGRPAPDGLSTALGRPVAATAEHLIGPQLTIGLAPTRMGPAKPEVAKQVVMTAARQPAFPAGDLPPLFDGRGLAEELAHLGRGLRPTLEERLAGIGPLLLERFELRGAAAGGDSIVLDGLGPDAVLTRGDELAFALPPGSVRAGAPLWQRAQALAWCAVDRARFLKSGVLLPSSDGRPVARFLQRGLSRSERAPMVGLAYVVWLRWFLGLATLWPARKTQFTYRAVAVLEEVAEARLLTLAG